MTIILKKGQRLEEVLPKTNREASNRKLNALKYVGVLKIKADPLITQKRMRDEWE